MLGFPVRYRQLILPLLVGVSICDRNCKTLHTLVRQTVLFAVKCLTCPLNIMFARILYENRQRKV